MPTITTTTTGTVPPMWEDTMAQAAIADSERRRDALLNRVTELERRDALLNRVTELERHMAELLNKAAELEELESLLQGSDKGIVHWNGIPPRGTDLNTHLKSFSSALIYAFDMLASTSLVDGNIFIPSTQWKWISSLRGDPSIGRRGNRVFYMHHGRSFKIHVKQWISDIYAENESGFVKIVICPALGISLQDLPIPMQGQRVVVPEDEEI